MRNKISLHIKKGGGEGNNGSTVWPGLIFYRVTHNSLALERSEINHIVLAIISTI